MDGGTMYCGGEMQDKQVENERVVLRALLEIIKFLKGC